MMLFAMCALLCSTALNAQTKRIAHGSHSGSAETFLPGDYGDNFGLAWPRTPVLRDTAAAAKPADTVGVKKEPVRRKRRGYRK